MCQQIMRKHKSSLCILLYWKAFWQKMTHKFWRFMMFFCVCVWRNLESVLKIFHVLMSVIKQIFRSSMQLLVDIYMIDSISNVFYSRTFSIISCPTANPEEPIGRTSRTAALQITFYVFSPFWFFSFLCCCLEKKVSNEINSLKANNGDFFRFNRDLLLLKQIE